MKRGFKETKGVGVIRDALRKGLLGGVFFRKSVKTLSTKQTLLNHSSVYF